MISEINCMIKEIRISKGYSQEELAERSGVSVRSIQRIENGESTPRGSTLQLISKALEVDLSVLLLEEKTNKKTVKELSKIQLMYLVSLAGVIMPLGGNFIAPAIVWKINKNESELINKVGKNIIFTQLLYSIITTTIMTGWIVLGKILRINYYLEFLIVVGFAFAIVNYGWLLYAGVKTKETIKRYYIAFYKI